MRLMEYLPEKYSQSRETVVFQEALQPEVDRIWAARDELLRQMNPRTADGWGLALWEEAFGLKPAAGTALAQRRSRVVAKIRGIGTVTAETLKELVESFLVHGVEVRERPRENWVDLQFSTAGVSPPPDLRDMLDALLEIFPAHLGLTLSSEAEVMDATAAHRGENAAFSVVELPEWRPDPHFAGTAAYGGGIGTISTTILPAGVYAPGQG